MKLREELDNRSIEKKGLVNIAEYFLNQEKQDLFYLLRKQADKGLTSYVISDYILSFPHLVNKKIFEDVLREEDLTFEYMSNGVDCLVKWGKEYK